MIFAVIEPPYIVIHSTNREHNWDFFEPILHNPSEGNLEVIGESISPSLSSAQQETDVLTAFCRDLW